MELKLKSKQCVDSSQALRSLWVRQLYVCAIWIPHLIRSFSHFNKSVFHLKIVIFLCWGCSSVVECLPSVFEVLGSIPNTGVWEGMGNALT
jgi:hypothetical protein